MVEVRRELMKAAASLSAALLCFSAPAVAEELYTTGPAEICIKENISPLGTIAVATPVDVLDKKDGYTKVKVNGWVLKDYPAYVFKAPGVRIEYGVFEAKGAVASAYKDAEDAAGNQWMKVSVMGWVSDKHLTSDIGSLWMKAQDRMMRVCSACHPVPEIRHFTANQWASQLLVRGAMVGHSRAGNNALMFKYIQEHAKPMK